MSIGIRALRSAGAATIALATVCTLALGAAGSAAADTGPAANVAVDLSLPPGALGSYPFAVNDNGVIVGYANDSTHFYPVRWNADLSPTALPLLPGDPNGEAKAVSDDGTAVGFSGAHTVRWAPDGTLTVLQLLPEDNAGWGYVSAISRTGTAVGDSDHGAASHAVKWARTAGPSRSPH